MSTMELEVLEKPSPRFSPEIVEVLKNWLYENRLRPYPTKLQKEELAARTNLTLRQVNNWMINARRRSLSKILQRDGLVRLVRDFPRKMSQRQKVKPVSSKSNVPQASRTGNNSFLDALVLAVEVIQLLEVERMTFERSS